MPLRNAKYAAAELGVGISVLYELASTGALPPVVLKQGKRKRLIRFRDEIIQKFIHDHEVPAGPNPDQYKDE